jgi:hypothetical protein
LSVVAVTSDPTSDTFAPGTGRPSALVVTVPVMTAGDCPEIEAVKMEHKPRTAIVDLIQEVIGNTICCGAPGIA